MPRDKFSRLIEFCAIVTWCPVLVVASIFVLINNKFIFVSKRSCILVLITRPTILHNFLAALFKLIKALEFVFFLKDEVFV